MIIRIPALLLCRWRLVTIALATAWLLGTPACLYAGQTGYWHTEGGAILDQEGQPVHINGINWYGFETPDRVAHGLTQQDYHAVLQQIQSVGFNVIRLPFANEVIESPQVPRKIAFHNALGPINTDLKARNSLEVMDKVVEAAGELNLHIILDNHRSDAGNGPQSSGLWYTSRFPEARWLRDWAMLVRRYKASRMKNGQPTLIGVDLRNEPHSVAKAGACWTGDATRGGCPPTNTEQNWTAAAMRAGNTILREAPDLLIFVQGTDCYNGSCTFWGSNLQGVREHKVVLTEPNRVVYSPHDYGPAEYRHPWFNDTATPGSLASVWTQNWAYLVADGVAPVWLGEFGTGSTLSEVASKVPGSQGQWFDTLLTFLGEHGISWSYWAINGEDRYGLLTPDYHSLEEAHSRVHALSQLIAATRDRENDHASRRDQHAVFHGTREQTQSGDARLLQSASAQRAR